VFAHLHTPFPHSLASTNIHQCYLVIDFFHHKSSIQRINVRITLFDVKMTTMALCRQVRERIRVEVFAQAANPPNVSPHGTKRSKSVFSLYSFATEPTGSSSTQLPASNCNAPLAKHFVSYRVASSRCTSSTISLIQPYHGASP